MMRLFFAVASLQLAIVLTVSPALMPEAYRAHGQLGPGSGTQSA